MIFLRVQAFAIHAMIARLSRCCGQLKRLSSQLTQLIPGGLLFLLLSPLLYPLLFQSDSFLFILFFLYERLQLHIESLVHLLNFPLKAKCDSLRSIQRKVGRRKLFSGLSCGEFATSRRYIMIVENALGNTLLLHRVILSLLKRIIVYVLGFLLALHLVSMLLDVFLRQKIHSSANRLLPNSNR